MNRLIDSVIGPMCSACNCNPCGCAGDIGERTREAQHLNSTQRCSSCKLPARLCDVPYTLEQHPGLMIACFKCRDAADTTTKIIALLASPTATGYALNQRTMARKLGRTALSLNHVLVHMSKLQLVEGVFSNPNLERPSARTYRLTKPVIAHLDAWLAK